MAEKRKNKGSDGTEKTSKSAQKASFFSLAPGFFGGSQKREPIILSTRIRLARNLGTHPFPGRANATQRQEVLESCAKVLAKLPQFFGGSLHDIGKLKSEERTLLVESHLISKELSSANGGAVFLSQDRTCSVMINEEDHLRIQIVHGGNKLKKAWKSADSIDTELSRALHFAFSPRLGYLTACPTNLGTGMRASYMLHLPGLVIAGQMERVCRALGASGIAVRGWLGEGSDAAGSIFQISNQHTLGFSEKEIFTLLDNWLAEIIKQETNARLRLLESDDMRLFDQISRAIGLLQNAMLLTAAEAMGALSLVRLACDLGVLPPYIRTTVDRLFIEVQPAHIQSANGILNPRLRDSFRAFLALREFRFSTPLAFNRLVKIPK